MKSISIIGCGWYGLPLAKEFVKLNYTVIGTTTSESKLEILSNSGIKAYYLKIDDQTIDGQISEILKSEIILINLPPGRHSNSKDFYHLKIKNLTKLIPKDRKVIFISSTSVYQNTNNITNENTICKPTTLSGQVLLKAEKLIRNYNTTIIRFAGLIGPNRIPGRFLAGKKNIANGQAPINLIHLDDCINVTIKIIENEIWGELFNACSSEHPQKQDYYIQAAKNQKFELPEFIDELTSFKIIDNNKITECLNYKFRSITTA